VTASSGSQGARGTAPRHAHASASDRVRQPSAAASTAPARDAATGRFLHVLGQRAAAGAYSRMDVNCSRRLPGGGSFPRLHRRTRARSALSRPRRRPGRVHHQHHGSSHPPARTAGQPAPPCPMRRLGQSPCPGIRPRPATPPDHVPATATHQAPPRTPAPPARYLRRRVSQARPPPRRNQHRPSSDRSGTFRTPGELRCFH